jgi:hypothetical protein
MSTTIKDKVIYKPEGKPWRAATYIEGEPLEDKLIKACFEGNIPIVKEILENNKVDINGSEAPNALGWALISANEELANYLISKGADITCQNAVIKDLDTLIYGDLEPGGFELSMRFTNYSLEKENPQRCLEKYCQEASLTLEILDRLLDLGADIHCCNEKPLEYALDFDTEGISKDPLKIAKTISALRDRGAYLNYFNYPEECYPKPGGRAFSKALKNGFKEAAAEVLKGLGEQELCKIIREFNEKEAIKLTEREITRRMRNFPDDILDRYKERASTILPEFLPFAVREFSHREAEKNMKKIEGKTKVNTLEI